MSVLLRVLPLVAAVAGLLLPAGAQVPVKGGEVSDFDFAVGVVERAYAGYPDKTANRAAEYGALKERLRSGIASGRDTYDAVAEYLGWFDDSHLGTEGVRAYRPKSIRRPSDYAARMERYDPQFTHCRVDGETYLIRFPSCDLNEEQTAWVRTAVRAYLASGCENLILDIRGNGGGSDSAYEPLLRLLYDHEGAEDAMEYRVSDLAVAHVREFAGDTERGRGKIARMERTPAGEFLTDGPKTYRILFYIIQPVKPLVMDTQMISALSAHFFCIGQRQPAVGIAFLFEDLPYLFQIFFLQKDIILLIHLHPVPCLAHHRSRDKECAYKHYYPGNCQKPCSFP